MGKSSKLSFPLQSKNRRPSTAVPTSSQSRDVQPLSKAERLLGASGLVPPRLSEQSHRQLAFSPSYLNLQLPTPDLSDSDGTISPTCVGDVFLPQLFPGDRQYTPHDMLGPIRRDVLFNSASTPETDSQQATNSRSSLTLRSFSDFKRLPMEALQQTSTSTIRERALRKGSAPTIQHVSPPDLATRPRTNDGGAEGGKRRPSRLDLAKLFSISSFSAPRLFSPSKRANSLPQSANTSDHLTLNTNKSSQRSSGRPTGNANRKSLLGMNTRIAKPNAQSHAELGLRSQENEDHIKTHVRRPPRHAQNWFDGLLEEEDEKDFEMEHEISTPNTEFFSPHVNHDPSEASSPACFAPALSIPQTVRSEDPVRSLPESDFSSSGVLALPAPQTPPSPSSVGMKECQFSSEFSILSSSSEAEDSDDEDIDARLPRMRASIQVSDTDNIHIGEAQAFALRPRMAPTVTLQNGRQQSQTSTRSSTPTSTILDSSSMRSSTNGSAVWMAPPKNRLRKSGHTRQPSSIQEGDSDEGSRTSSSNTTTTSGQSLGDAEPPAEACKLMAVTEEEEALLGMMRRKRAAMVKHSFAEGFKTAMRNEIRDPKTPKNTLRKPADNSVDHHLSRNFRHSNSSSTMLDCFPMSRSQRNSLIMSKPTQANMFMLSSDLGGPISPGDPRRLSKPLSSSVVEGTPSFDSFTFPPLPIPFTKAEVINIPSPNSSPSHGTNSPSPEPYASPVTPGSGRSNAEISVIGSNRDSQASYTMNATVEDEIVSHAKAPQVISSHIRSRTASSSANMLLDSDSECGNGDAVDPALVRKDRRTSIASTADMERLTNAARTADRARHSRSYDAGFGPSIDTRCSVSEDVLAAWGSLGGWKA